LKKIKIEDKENEEPENNNQNNETNDDDNTAEDEEDNENKLDNNFKLGTFKKPKKKKTKPKISSDTPQFIIPKQKFVCSTY